MAAGAWCCGFRASAARTICALALLERDIVVHPGYFYDLPHDGFVVISLLAGEADVREGLDALCALPLLQLA